MRRKLSLSAKSMAVSLLLAGGIAIGGVSTSEAATFYGGNKNRTVVVLMTVVLFIQVMVLHGCILLKVMAEIHSIIWLK